MRAEQGAYVIENESDFWGWEILHIEDYKPGVKRVFMQRPTGMGQEFTFVYSDEKYTKNLPFVQLHILQAKVAALEVVVKSTLLWRKDWIDEEDMQEMRNGCKCEICQLIRACDEYNAHRLTQSEFEKEYLGSFEETQETNA